MFVPFFRISLFSVNLRILQCIFRFEPKTKKKPIRSSNPNKIRTFFFFHSLSNIPFPCHPNLHTFTFIHIYASLCFFFLCNRVFISYSYYESSLHLTSTHCSHTHSFFLSLYKLYKKNNLNAQNYTNVYIYASVCTLCLCAYIFFVVLFFSSFDFGMTVNWLGVMNPIPRLYLFLSHSFSFCLEYRNMGLGFETGMLIAIVAQCYYTQYIKRNK